MREAIRMTATHNVLGLLLVLSAPTLVPPAVLAQVTERVLRVHLHHPMASDSNPGTAELPYKTINHAAQMAIANQAQRLATRIIIFPGTYREAITLETPARSSETPILFAAKDPGTVTIAGSDVWSGWSKRDQRGFSTHPWPYKWGVSANPWASEHITVEPIVRRREMIFVQGQALKQASSLATLREKGFYVAEDEGLVYLAWPAAVDLSTLTVEVATREHLFSARQASQVTLRGLRFQHAASPLQESAVRFTDASHITIEDCQFLWNNWGGLGFWDVAHLLVTRNIANHNGALGMVLWKAYDLLFVENETSYNNWRGAQGGFHGWAVAGIKTLRLHHAVYRQHKAIGNEARGFWLDYDHADITIERAIVCGNALDGMFIEASQGPVVVKQSTLCRNARGAGLLSTNSRGVTLEENMVYDNGGPQLKITGGSERQVGNWQTGVPALLRAEDWLLRGNTFVAQHATQLLVEIPPWPHLLQSLTGVRNTWYHPSHTHVFKVGQRNLDFAAWQGIIRQDVGSRFTAPDLPELYRSGVFSAAPLPP